MEKPIGLPNWKLLQNHRKILNKYLDILQTDPKDVERISPSVYKFYNTLSQEDMIWWLIFLDSLKDLLGREEREVEKIIRGKIRWEVE